MLTFEYEKIDEAVHIHADASGLRKLASSLVWLAEQVEKKGPDHLHLMTDAWGGNSLSGEAQSKTSELINHVKVFGWGP
jgi:hypothetical protein